MILITTLGTTPYTKIAYHWQGHEPYSSPLVQEVIAHYLKPTEVRVLTTKLAKEKNWDLLEKRLSPHILKPIEIGDNQNEEEMWGFFNVLTKEFTTNEEIVVDVTHGFRSTPLLLMLALAFLRMTHRVNISQVLYGAADTEKGTGTICDLTPFLELLDWATAADIFNQTGDATRFATLLKERHIYLRKKTDQQTKLPTELQNLGGKLKELSQALEMMRPVEIGSIAHELDQKFIVARDDVEQFSPAFSLLLDQVQQSFEPLKIEKGVASVRTHLLGEWQLIEWYMAKQRYVQALTLMREWLITVVCYRCGYDWQNKDRREIEAKDLLREASEGKQVLGFAKIEGVGSLWAKVTNSRNDLEHCGMRSSPQPTKKLMQNTEAIAKEMSVIADVLREEIADATD